MKTRRSKTEETSLSPSPNKKGIKGTEVSEILLTNYIKRKHRKNEK